MSETLPDTLDDFSRYREPGTVFYDQTPEEIVETYRRRQSNPLLDAELTAEQVSQSPEGQSHEESIARFNDAWKLPGDVSKRQLDEFYDIVRQVREDLVDKTATPRVNAVMEQYQWLYFGPGSELPVGTAVVDKRYQPPRDRRTNRLRLVSTEVMMTTQDAGIITAEFYDQGLARIDDERKNIRMADMDLEDRYKDVLKTSPQYRFLASFLHAGDMLTDQPLSIAEKQLAAAMAEAVIRQRFGIADNLRLSDHPSPAPRQALARQLYRIDEDTKPSKQVAENSVQRAKHFFKQDIRQWALEREFPQDAQQIVDDLENRDFINPFSRNAYAAYLNQRLGAGKTDIYDGERIIEFFLSKLLGNQPEDYSIEDCLRHGLEAHGGHPKNFILFLAERNLSAEQIVRLRGGADISFVKPPADEPDIKPVRFFSLPKVEDIFIEARADISSQDDYEAEANKVMAEVEYRPGYNDAASRLIEFESDYFDIEAPMLHKAPTDDFDLKLAFATKTELVGRIAGYDLIAIRGDEMFFRMSPADDPYRRPERPLTVTERQHVEQSVAGLGATHLSKYLRKQKRLTLNGLVDAVRQTSDYTFDTSINGEDSLLPGVGLKAGRLQMQCDGSAVVLRRLLSGLGGHSMIVTGLVAQSGGPTVSAMHHAQVDWVDDDGLRYRLDATPGGNGATGSESNGEPAMARGRFFGRLLGRRPEQDSIPEQRLEATPQLPDSKPTSAFELVEIKPPVATPSEVIDRINLQLRALVGARNNNELYEKAVKLSEADPVRRTLEAAMQVRKQSTEAIDLAGLEEYLSNLQKADDQTLKRLRLPKYQSDTLQQLQTFVQQLSSLSKV